MIVTKDYPSKGIDESEKELKMSDKCWLAGWGLTDSNSTDKLLKSRVYMNTPDCKRKRRVDGLKEVDGVICSGQNPKINSLPANACQMDSGSPLVCRDQINGTYFLEGIVSYG